MRPQAKLRAFYFFFFAGVGAYIPFFPPYLRGLGFSGSEIGRAQMVGTLAAAPAAMIWATLADRAGALTRGVQLAVFWSFVVLAFLPFVHTPAAVGLLLFLNGCAMPAVGPLADAVTVETVRASGGHGAAYTRVRLFGSLGYIVGAQVLGFALAARGERAGDVAMPLALVACTGAAGLVALGFPHIAVAPKPSEARPAFRWRSNLNLILLFAAATVHSASTTPYYQLFGVLVRDLALPSSVTAMAMALGVLAEIGAMMSFHALERRFALGTLLMLAFSAGSLRWGLMWQATTAAQIIVLQLLHGLSFGLFWGALVKAIAKLVPTHLRATGQAVFGSLTASLAGAFGYPMAGWAYDAWHGAPPVFAAAAIAELVPFALAALLRARGL